MALTSAMFTGLTGMNSNQFKIDTIGDNVANVNTTAFKSSRASFENQFAITLSGGSGPSETSGGTNPVQVGLGSQPSSVQRNFGTGALETTGVPTDMAIEGSGFFILDTPDQRAFTRDGTFRLNADNELVSADGFHVLGYGVNDDFDIEAGELTRLSIPIGTLSTARQTQEASLDGNLNADGVVGSQGTILNSQALTDTSGSPVTADTLLTELTDPDDSASPLFEEGNTITIGNAKKGERQLPEVQFEVTATSTLGDFLAELENVLGINSDAALNDSPGITVSDSDPPGEGVIVIEGNAGEANQLEIELAAILSDNEAHPTPFRFTETQEAIGESIFTSFIAYDSLGTPVQVDLTMVLDSKSNTGNTWRFFAESFDDTDATPVLGETGTVTFDTDGEAASFTNTDLLIDRDNTGAVTPMQFSLDFTNVTGLTTQESTLVMTSQDGFASGTLTNFSVGKDGILTGTFSNGLTRDLGQVTLATFTNQEGLIGGINNLFLTGPNSGEPVITAPGTLGAGQVLGGALELSNVDLTREFIGLITASTGFSAAGRVISTSNDLLNELLLIAR